MGTIDTASLKWYQSATFNDTATSGGNINTSGTITSNTAQNWFTNTPDSERVSGTTRYRKGYLRNENADTYTNATCWIDTNTPCTGDAVWLCQAGTLSQSFTSASLTGTATFGSDEYVYTSSNLTSQVKKGERIYNATDDASTLSATISSVAATVITLTGNYGGTAGSSKLIYVAPANTNTFYQPTSADHANALALGDLANNSSAGVWIKLVQDAGGQGYQNNTFILKVQQS